MVFLSSSLHSLLVSDVGVVDFCYLLWGWGWILAVFFFGSWLRTFSPFFSALGFFLSVSNPLPLLPPPLRLRLTSPTVFAAALEHLWGVGDTVVLLFTMWGHFSSIVLSPPLLVSTVLRIATFQRLPFLTQ